jgi:hypothetical protein
MEGPTTGLITPAGFANPQTPSFASVQCGSIVQSAVWTTDGDAETSVGFTEASSWTTPNWLAQDISGFIWTCQTPGIYNVVCQQNLTLHNIADATNPIVNLTLSVRSDTTSEFNDAFTTSIPVPITTAPITMTVSVGGVCNADLGSEMLVTLQSLGGNVTVSSGTTFFPAPKSYLGWNLIAPGAYGNGGILV